MVFSSDNVERGNPQQEQGIFSKNFGGLNTTASNINCPYEDSPLLHNVDIDISGRLVKRKGTKTLWETDRTPTLGYTLIPFTTGLEYTFLIEKYGRDINVYSINDDVSVLEVSKSNVWDNNGASVKATWAISAETIPKIFMCTGVNKPVRLSFIELQRVATGTTSNFVMVDASLLKNASLVDIIVYKNRTRVTPSSISYNATNRQYTLNGVSTVANDVIDVVFVCWQFVAEAMIWNGNEFYDKTSRFNAVVTDQTVTVPEGIRNDPLFDDPTGDFRYGTTLLKSSSTTDTYTFVSNREPSTSDEYAFSNGARYVYAPGNKTDPTPFFITFGDVIRSGGTPTGDITEVHFNRVRQLKYLNGGLPLIGNDLFVYVNDKIQSYNVGVSLSSTYMTYRLYGEDLTTYTTSTGGAAFLKFDGATTAGVPSTSEVKAVHIELSNIGSAAVAECHIDNPYKDGTAYPIYGLGRFADYYAGSYPRNVAIFQGRMYLSGFLNNSLRVAVSELYDKTTPLEYYQNFNLSELQVLADDPFDFNINSNASDYTTGMIGWQQSLFIFTRQAVYRLVGGENGISNTSSQLSLLSRSGLVNPYSVTVTEKDILYLSDYGVYSLFNSIETDEYQAGEESIKIRKVFGITTNPTYQILPWMSYDSTTQKVYLGYPVEGLTYTSYKLYIYNTYRKSWTEYKTNIGFPLYYGTEYVDRINGRGFIGAGITKTSSNVPTNFVFIKFEHPRFLDYLQTYVANGSTSNFDTPFSSITINDTLTAEVNVYPITVESLNNYNSYNPIPIQNVNDVFIEQETFNGSGVFETLEFGTHYVKQQDGNIYLLQNPGDGRDIRFTPRLPVTDSEAGQTKYGVTSPQNYYPVVVFVNSLFVRQGEVYDFNTDEIVFDTNPSASSFVEVGMAYQVMYTSPMLSLQSFNSLKRARFIYVYFDNEQGQQLFTAADVNAAAGQTEGDLVGLPVNELNVSIGILYDNEFDAEQVVDIYGFESLVWDDSLFDVYNPSSSFRRYILFKESLQGIGYAYQLLLWSFDETTFAMTAYQIAGTPYANRYIRFNG